MSNTKHIGRVGGLAAALGVGLAVAATPGVAWASPSGTGSSSTDSASSSSSSATGSSDSGSESTPSRGASASPGSADASADSSSTTSSAGGYSTSSGGADIDTESANNDTPALEGTTSDATPADDGSTDTTSPVEQTRPEVLAVDTAATPLEQPGAAAGTEQPTTADSPAQPGPSTVAVLPGGSSDAARPSTPAGRHGTDAPDRPVADTANTSESPHMSPPAQAPVHVATADPLTPKTAAVQTATNATAHPAAPLHGPHVAAATFDTTAPFTRWTYDSLASTPPEVGRMQALIPAIPAPSEAGAVASRVLTSVLGAIGLHPFLSADPVAPIESPMFWALVAAWCRRQEQANTADATRSLSQGSVTTSQPVETFAALSADTSSFAVASEPTVDPPIRSTGLVSGSINSPGSFAVFPSPTYGSVVIDMSGDFTYIPTQAARQTAALDPSGDYDTFTLTNTETNTPVTVRVPVSAARLQVVQSTTVGSTPSGVAIIDNSPAFVDSRAYVANQSSRTVSVIGAADTVLATIPVGSSPTGVAANPTGTQVYVTNSGSRNVSVINTATNNVAATINVGTTPNAVAFNGAGTYAYVTNGGSGNVSVINTATRQVIATVRVGTTPNAVAIAETSNGTYAYVTNGGSGNVSVINTATNTAVATVKVGTTPNAVAIAETSNGTYAYVSNRGSSTVSVIDTASNTVVGTIGVGSRPTSVVATPDGSAVYVVSDVDRLTVLDTNSNTVLSTVAIDNSAETGAHTIALSTSGSRMLVTDTVERRVRVLSLAHVNSAPSATWTSSEPQTSDGAVTITLKLDDPDGDLVTVTHDTAESGIVVSDGISTLTYTPTPAARDLAAQPAGPHTDRFTITVTDGQNATNIPVDVAISPTPPAAEFDVDSTTIVVGSGGNNAANEAVIVDDRLYVLDFESNSIVVVDRDTNSVVGDPIPYEGAYAWTIAADPAIDRVYVSGAWDSSISVIDSATNTVVDTIYVEVSPDFQGYTLVKQMAVYPDPDGPGGPLHGRLYVSGEDGTVSAIDTAANDVVAAEQLGYFGDLDVSPDGRHLYGGDPYGDTVAVIDTASMTRVATVRVGPEWDLNSLNSEFTDGIDSVAVSPDGDRLYVTYQVTSVERASGGYSSGMFYTDSQGRLWRVTGQHSIVAVIDRNPASATYGTEIDTLRMDDFAQDVALSPDGTLAYVTNGDGRTVTVIHTTTLDVIATFVTDPNGRVPARYGTTRSVLVADDGQTLYVTDPSDGAVYAVTGAPAGNAAVMV